MENYESVFINRKQRVSVNGFAEQIAGYSGKGKSNTGRNSQVTASD